MEVNARSVQVFNLDSFNLIDLDSYGDCREVWHSLAQRIRSRTAVFITYGFEEMGTNWSLSNFLKSASGIPASWPIPGSRELLNYLAMRFVINSLTQFHTENALYCEKRPAGCGAKRKESVNYYGFIVSHPQ